MYHIGHYLLQIWRRLFCPTGVQNCNISRVAVQ